MLLSGTITFAVEKDFCVCSQLQTSNHFSQLLSSGDTIVFDDSYFTLK